MKYKQLGLRVLSTAALMSIVSSIAASAFAGVYYINEGNIDVDVDADGKVKVTQNGTTYEDANGEVIIRGGSASDYEDGRTDKGIPQTEETTIGETYTTEEEPAEEIAEGTQEPEEEPAEEPEAEETVEASDEGGQEAEEEAPAEEPEAEETVEASDEDGQEAEEEPAEEPEAEETVEASDEDAPESEEETPAKEPEMEETTGTPAKREAPDTAMDGMTVDETTGKMSGYYVASGPKSETQTEEDGSAKDIESTDHTISIKNDWVNSAKEAFKFILENVNIVNKNTSKAAMSVTGQGDTTVELDGDNVLKNDGYDNSHAALEKNGDAAQTGTLTITDEDEIDGDDSKRGSLTAATGGYSGAAIGGARGNSGENIHITGNAYVNASATSGAAIGGGNSYRSSKKDGSDGNHIHIDGNAYVVAKGSDRAIGGSDQESSAGKGGDAKDIVISGTSTVYADGGIGSGGTGTYGNKGGDTDITIKGNSTVYANSRGNNYANGYNGGTTIGSGYGGNTVIKIAENAKVKSVVHWYSSYSNKYFVNSTSYGVGIGGYGGNTDVTITDNAIIGDGSGNIGISGSIGKNQEVASVTISDNATIGKLADGAYIGSGTDDDENRTGKTINILIKDNAWIKKVTRIGSRDAKTDVKILDNATIEELPGDGGHAIGSRYAHSTITIGGSSVEGEEQTGTVTIKAGGKNSYSVIGAGFWTNSDVKINGNVDLVLKSANGKYIMAGGDTPVTDAQLKQMLEDAGATDSTISYLDEDGNIIKIIHSSDLCEPDKDAGIVVDTAPTCTTPGKGHFTCAYEKNHGATGEDLYHTGAVENVEIPALGHNFNDWHVTKKATCTEAGEMQRECQREGCTEVETETIAVDPTNHANIKVDGKQDATCEGKGYTGDTVCEDCGTTIEKGHDIDATGHDWGEWEVTTPATCTTEGVETRVCKNDANHTDTKSIPKNTTAHAWGEWKVTKEATCTEEGEETRVCTRDESHTETKSTPKNTDAHAWGEWTVTTEPGCTTKGEETRYCHNNKEHTETRDVDPTGHTWGKGTITKMPGCTTEGEVTYPCTVCGETETKPVNPLGHDFANGSWKTVKEATCLEEGLQEKQCSRCDALDESETRKIDATGHAWGEWTTTKEATCTADGEQERVCENDPAHKETRKIDAAGHKYGEWETVTDATCTTEGEEKHTCSECGDVETRKTEIDPNAHDYQDDWTVTTEPGCTTKGEETRYCHNNKEHTETRDIDPAGHGTNHIENQKDATEDKEGYTGDKVCDKCGDVVEKGHDIPKLEHNWVDDGAHVGATCTTDGYQDQKCTNDGCSETRRVWDHPEDTEHKGDGTSHNYDGQEWIEVKKGTCTDEGEAIRKCSNAPEDETHYEHKKTDKVPSNHGDHETEIVGKEDPTCTEPGYTGDEKCTGCGEVVKKGEDIPATGHQHLTEGVDKKDPTCEEPGYTGDTVCDDCGQTVTKGEDIPATGHTPTVVGKKDPTETEPGYTGDTVCDTCGKVLESGTVLPTTGSNDSNVACELRVVVPGSTLRELWFTVRQSGGERTYTCKQDNATLTGSLETLQYLQSQGADTIVFVTNGRVSRFAVADLLALCNEGDVFYLCHTADAEPTLLIIANDHTELLNS